VHQPALLDSLAVEQRDLFRVLPDAHEVVAKVGLDLLLLVVERHQRPADQVGAEGHHDSESEHDPDEIARHAGEVEAADLIGELRRDPPQDLHESVEAQARDEDLDVEARGVLHEIADVLGDALIGIVRLVGLEAQSVVHLVAEPLHDVAVCHPPAPVDLEKLRQVVLGHGPDDPDGRHDREVEKLRPERHDVLVLQRRVEAVVPEAQENRQVDLDDVEHDDHAEQAETDPAFRHPPRAEDAEIEVSPVPGFEIGVCQDDDAPDHRHEPDAVIRERQDPRDDRGVGRRQVGKPILRDGAGLAGCRDGAKEDEGQREQADQESQHDRQAGGKEKHTRQDGRREGEIERHRAQDRPGGEADRKKAGQPGQKAEHGGDLSKNAARPQRRGRCDEDGRVARPNALCPMPRDLSTPAPQPAWPCQDRPLGPAQTKGAPGRASCSRKKPSGGLQVAGGSLARLAIGEDLVRDLLALDQLRQTGALDCGDVDEHVAATIIRLDEAVALLVVEPLHGSGAHR
jgi:hypothetical protein